MFNGTTGIIASLQLNLNVGNMAEPLTSKIYDDKAVGIFLKSYPLGPKNILYFYKNYPSLFDLKITNI